MRWLAAAAAPLEFFHLNFVFCYCHGVCGVCVYELCDEQRNEQDKSVQDTPTHRMKIDSKFDVVIIWLGARALTTRDFFS